MKYLLRKNTWQDALSPHGWGNGYVIIPKGHILHGIHYDNIPVSVHGGLTFSESADSLDWVELSEDDKEGWVVGFDTAHYGDNRNTWLKEDVAAETVQLKERIKALVKNSPLLGEYMELSNTESELLDELISKNSLPVFQRINKFFNTKGFMTHIEPLT